MQAIKSATKRAKTRMIVIHSAGRSGGHASLLPPRTLQKMRSGPPNVTKVSAPRTT
jgi:hypothetical protein